MTLPYAVSDHCDGRRFFNPEGTPERRVADLVRWWRTRASTPWPASVPVRAAAVPASPPPPGSIEATFVGHATFLTRTAAASVLTDPVFTSHAGPFGRFGPRRVRRPGLALDALPPIDVVIVSHNHYDHLQPSSLRAIEARHHPQFVTTLGLGRVLSRLGLTRVIELDWWQTAELACGMRATCVPARHFSARTPFDRNRTLWGGFVLGDAHATVYFAGDTAYSRVFGEIARRVPPIDLALVPIGAYEPRWFMHVVHANPEEAVRIHRDVGARVSVAMHFGTFRLTDEGIEDPVRALADARLEAGLPPEAFQVLDVGQTVLLEGGHSQLIPQSDGLGNLS